MTAPDEPDDDLPSDPDAGRESIPGDPMAALLKRALAEPASPPSSILRGVQRRIRKRSRGRFFADGWSTTEARVNPVLIAAAMLLILVLAYFALGPVGVQ